MFSRYTLCSPYNSEILRLTVFGCDLMSEFVEIYEFYYGLLVFFIHDCHYFYVNFIFSE